MFLGFVTSSIGKKFLMALTGLMLLGFLTMHLLGNLLLFLGPDYLNAYAKHLKDLGPFLWLARLSLLTAIGIHIWSASALTLENLKARPVPYQVYKTQKTTLAAKTMIVSGSLVIAYLAYHLLHFTIHTVHPEFSKAVDAHGHLDVYHMVVSSFSHWPIAVTYIAAMALIFSHLYHGISSAFQTLGLSNSKLLRIWEALGALYSTALFLGYSTIPLACALGLIKVTSQGVL